MYQFIFLYLLSVNLLAFAIMVLDKRAAINNYWRVPEKTLWALALTGGSLGLLIASKIVRHKTKKKIFVMGLPLILFGQCTFLYYLLK